MKRIVLAVAALAAMAGCTRIETGEVGLRRNFDKTISSGELQPGSINQTLVGDVITFPVRDIAVALDNKTPLTSDNSALADFDITVIYGITPSAVSDLYTQKSASFHAVENGDIILMKNYIATTVNNAVYKVVRQYKALEVSDNRSKVEAEIKAIIVGELHEQKLDSALTVSQVQVRNVLPAAEIIKSANDVVRARNELLSKEIEVQTARKEAERVAALNSNGNAIAYMQAQAGLTIAEAIKAGKVNTIVVPQDFKGIVNVK